MYTIPSIILVAALLTARAEVPFTRTPLDNTGIIFEEVSNALLYENQWTIFTAVKMTRVSIWEDYLDWSENTIKKVCQQYIVLGLNDTCNRDIQNVQYISGRIKLALQKIEISQVDRSRRSLFDGVGKFSNFLFGTMDQDDAERIYSRLDNLEVDNKQNLDLIKEQVSLMKSNYESNSEALEKFNTDLQETKNQTINILNTINKTTAKIFAESKTIQLQLSLDETTMNIIIRLQEIEHQIENLYIILNSLGNKQLHPLVISYPQVVDLVKNLPTFHARNEILQDPFILQQLASVESIYSQERILCKVTIPLIQKEWFSIKKAYPLPMLDKKNISIHYDIPEDYLITDEGANKFIPLVDSQLKPCKMMTFGMTKQTLICPLMLPLYTAPDEHCLLLLYKGWPEANEICTTSPLLQEHNMIIKMVTQNYWLYL